MKGRAGNDFFVRVCTKLFWSTIYCANPRLKPDPQSGYLCYKGLGRQAPRIIWEYDIVTVIVIRPLTQPGTCEMGSSSFAAMIQLKAASMTRASFPSIPSTERTNMDFFSVALGNYYHDCSSFISLPSQECSHWPFLVGVTVWVP